MILNPEEKLIPAGSETMPLIRLWHVLDAVGLRAGGCPWRGGWRLAEICVTATRFRPSWLWWLVGLPWVGTHGYVCASPPGFAGTMQGGAEESGRKAAVPPRARQRLGVLQPSGAFVGLRTCESAGGP